jgi:hypothetical protein
MNGHEIAGRNFYAIYGAALCAARRKVYNVDTCDRGLLIAWNLLSLEGTQLRLLEPHWPRWSIPWLSGAQGSCNNKLSLGKQTQGEGTLTACGTSRSLARDPRGASPQSNTNLVLQRSAC